MAPMLLYRWGNRGSEGSSALLKVTQLGERGLEAAGCDSWCKALSALPIPAWAPWAPLGGRSRH